jgi:small-conductance mechanosensitive channel
MYQTIPLLAIFYSVTVVFSLLAVYEMHLRSIFFYTFVDEGLVVRSVQMLSQFSQDVVDCLLVYATTLFVRNAKDYLVKRYLVRSITDGQFADQLSSKGIKGNTRPLARLVEVINRLLNYVLYLVGFIAGLDAFGFDVTPLVASLSGISVLVGIGMREVLENVAGAMTLYVYSFLRTIPLAPCLLSSSPHLMAWRVRFLSRYLAPPFAVGDRVRFIAADGLDSVQAVVEGIIDEVGVLRTVVRTENSVCYLANSMCLKLVVENMSLPAK